MNDPKLELFKEILLIYFTLNPAFELLQTAIERRTVIKVCYSFSPPVRCKVVTLFT